MHRDVKPANFLMGPDVYSSSQPSSCDRVNVIDFGLAKKYTYGPEGKHIKNSLCDSHGVGTPLFASINTHRGEGMCGFILFYFIWFSFVPFVLLVSNLILQFGMSWLSICVS